MRTAEDQMYKKMYWHIRAAWRRGRSIFISIPGKYSGSRSRRCFRAPGASASFPADTNHLFSSCFIFLPLSFHILLKTGIYIPKENSRNTPQIRSAHWPPRSRCREAKAAETAPHTEPPCRPCRTTWPRPASSRGAEAAPHRQHEALLNHEQRQHRPHQRVADRQTEKQRRLGELVRQRIDEFSEFRNHVEPPGDLAVKHVRQPGDADHNGRRVIVSCAVRRAVHPRKHRNQQDPKYPMRLEWKKISLCLFRFSFSFVSSSFFAVPASGRCWPDTVKCLIFSSVTVLSDYPWSISPL